MLDRKRLYLLLSRMNFCYLDESGTGPELYAVMVGIVVDSTRMHVTKQDWSDLLAVLSRLIGRKVMEIHTRDFYLGNVLKVAPHAYRSIFRLKIDNSS